MQNSNAVTNLVRGQTPEVAARVQARDAAEAAKKAGRKARRKARRDANAALLKTPEAASYQKWAARNRAGSRWAK